MGICNREGADGRRLVVLSLLSTPIPESQLRAGATSAVLVSGNRVPGVVGRFDLWRGSFRIPDETRFFDQCRTQVRDVSDGNLCPADRLCAASWSDVSQQSVACDPAVGDGGRCASGLVCKSFFNYGGYVPSTAVSTVVGFGGAMGAAGGAIFTTIVKHTLSLHPLFVFGLSSLVYLIALGIMHLLVPRLGEQAMP